MADLNKITVKKTDIVMRHCDSCGTTTAHVGKTDGTRMAAGLAGPHKLIFSTCIQCWLDSNNIVEWSRWLDPLTGKRLETPRGYGSH